MRHYDYQVTLSQLWSSAVERYQQGQRGAGSYFTAEQTAWLHENGLTAQELYDFAEDFAGGGEPDFATFAMVTDIRRSFFLHQLGGVLNPVKTAPSTYPAKTAEVDGITWMPRIIAKAKDKLRGTLDSDTMYGCGGDRRFLRESNIHLAEFLAVVRDNLDNDRAVIDFVKARRRACGVA